MWEKETPTNNEEGDIGRTQVLLSQDVASGTRSSIASPNVLMCFPRGTRLQVCGCVDGMASGAVPLLRSVPPRGSQEMATPKSA